MFKKRKAKSVNTGLDALRIAMGTFNPKAPKGRVIHHEEMKEVRIARYFTRGLYPNDLVRIDDYINALKEKEKKGQLDFHLTKKAPFNIPFIERKLTKEWAQNFQLLQELIAFAHIALDERRSIEEGFEGEVRLILLNNFKVGNQFFSDNDSCEGISARFLFFYKDGDYYESFAYINDGMYGVTRPEKIELETKKIDQREWPEISSAKFVNFDETLNRVAGRYLISSDEDLGIDVWFDNDDNNLNPNERVKPELPDEDNSYFMDTVSFKSMWTANYVPLEGLILAFATLVIAQVGAKPGILASVIPIAVAVSLICLMVYMAIKILDSFTARTIILVRDKPEPKVWRAAHVVRLFITLLSTVILMAASTVIFHRVNYPDDPSLSIIYPNEMKNVYTLCVLLVVAVWCATGSWFSRNIHINPITGEMETFKTVIDVLILSLVITLFAVVISLPDSFGSITESEENAMVYFFIGILASFTLVRWFFSRMSSMFAPIRSLENHKYPKYVHNDSGLTRSQWNEKHKMEE